MKRPFSRHPFFPPPLFSLLVLLWFAACSGVRWSGPGSDRLCAVMDSLCSRGFLQRPFSLRGKARFDVNQYRLRGNYQLTVSSFANAERSQGSLAGETARSSSQQSGEFKVFEFVSSSLFGSHREDVSISLSEGMIRILDRERGEYYQGDDAQEFIARRLGFHGDVKEVIDLALGCKLPCNELTDLSMGRLSSGGYLFTGKVRGGKFRFDLSRRDGKLSEIRWPVVVEKGEIEELRISYGWDDRNSTLKSIVISIDRRKWRVKLTVTGQSSGNSLQGASDAVWGKSGPHKLMPHAAKSWRSPGKKKEKRGTIR